MPKNKTSIAIILLLLLAAIKLAILVWSVDKGFEMTDEGYYLLWFNSAHLYAPDMHLNYYYLVQLLFGWVDWDITAMRIGGIVTEVGAVLSLGWGLSKYLKAKLPELYSPAFVTVLLVGGFAALFTAEHPRSLSYDSVTHLLMAIGGGLLLVWLSFNEKPKGWHLIGFFTLLGVILASQFIVKFSSTILLAVLWLVVTLSAKQKKGDITLAAFGTVLGMGLLFTGLFGTQISLSTFLEYYRISYERISQLGYSPIDIVLKTYLAKDTVHFVLNIGPALLIILGALFAFKNQETKKRTFRAMALGLVVFVMQAFLFPTNYFPQWHYRFIDLLLLLIISGSYVAWQFTTASRAVLVLVVTLFAIPFVCAIGSAVNWAMSLFSYLPAWIMLVIVLWQYIGQQIGMRVWPGIVQYGIITGSFLIFFQLFLYPNYLPHGMAASMFEQTEQAVAYDQVKLDAPTAKFVTETEQLLTSNGFKPGNYLLALYDLPGLVYLMQGYSPQVPWYFGENTRATVKEAVDNTCWHINEMSETNVFVVKPVTVHPDVANCLSSSKLNFPTNYLMAGTVYNTYCKCEMEVWAPKQ
jgi:hypothetical protein